MPHDERKAAEWFKSAANQGHVRAQSALSDLYLTVAVFPETTCVHMPAQLLVVVLRGKNHSYFFIEMAQKSANDTSPD